MFNNVNGTAFVDATAESVFRRKIYSNGISFDNTFLGTTRALVLPRLKEDQTVELVYVNSSYSDRNVAEYSNNCEYSDNSKILLDAVSYVNVASSAYSEIILANITPSRSGSSTDSMFKFIENTFTKVYGDKWQRMNKVTDFFRKQFRAIAYINMQDRRAIMFCDNLDVKKYHYSQCAIVALMPWFFEDGISEEETALVNSLRERTPDDYIAITNNMILKYDLERNKIETMLKGYESRNLVNLLANTENSIQTIIDDISSYKERISRLLAQKEELEYKMFGIHNKINEETGDSELIDFFMRNKSIHLENVDGNYLTFLVTSTFEYYDEDLLDSLINNERSVLYSTGATSVIKHDDMAKFMKAVFIDKRYSINVCAAYTINSSGHVDALSRHNYGLKFRNYFPNPHIDRYSCIGNYNKAILELLEKHDYIGAICQCIASCKSINFGDYPVMQEFTNRLNAKDGTDFQKYGTIKCVQDNETGEIMTVKQAIKYINEESKEEEVNDNE